MIERLRSPQLSHGMARELRKHVAILDREKVDLEQVCSARARRKRGKRDKRLGIPQDWLMRLFCNRLALHTSEPVPQGALDPHIRRPFLLAA